LIFADKSLLLKWWVTNSGKKDANFFA